MGKYLIEYSRKSLKDAKKLKSAGLQNKTELLINLIKENPFVNPPGYEKLSGDLEGLYSRRINRQHRLVYEVIASEHKIRILSMWTHYESHIHEEEDKYCVI